MKLISLKRKNYKVSETRDALLFVGIGLVLFSVFVFYPQMKNIWMAFTDYNIMPNVPNTFVGFDNFRRMFFSDGILGESQFFWMAFRNSLWAVLVTVPGQLLIGLYLAVTIHNLTRGHLLYKILLYIPVISSWVIVSLLFMYLFQDTRGGLINYGLLQAGLIDTPIAWLQNTTTANIVIWLLCIWKGVGWVVVIYTAALQSMPKDVYEAAVVDGAGPFRTFLSITVPLLKSTTIWLIVQLTIGAFGILIQVMLITGGGPMGTTETLNSLMFSKAFSQFQFGYAAAISLIMGTVVISMTLIQRKIFKEGR